MTTPTPAPAPMTARLRELMEKATPGPICESALVPLYAVQDYGYNEAVAAFAEFDDEGELTMQFQGDKAKANLALYTFLVNHAPTILRLLEAVERYEVGDDEIKRRLKDVLPEYCTQLLDDVSAKLDKLARITAMAETGTAENFLACDDETKRLYFAQGVEDSAALKAARSELAEARKVEDGEVADRVRELIGWELPEDASDDLVRRHFIDNKSAGLLTRLSAALKEAERRETEAKTLQHQLASDLTVAVARAQAAEAKLETLRKVFAPMFKQFGPEWPDGEGLEVVLSHPDDEDGEEGVGACHFTLGQLRRALQTKDTP